MIKVGQVRLTESLGIFIEQAAAHQTKGMKGIGSVECWRGRIIARFGRNRQ